MLFCRDVLFLQSKLKKIRIIRDLIGVAILFNILQCFVLSFNHSTTNRNIPFNEVAKVQSLVSPLGQSLISNYPVNSPTPTLTKLNDISLGSVLFGKCFYQASLFSAEADVSFFNFFLSKTSHSILQVIRLHLKLCVLRI